MPFLYGFKPKYWKECESILPASAAERGFCGELPSRRLTGKALLLKQNQFQKVRFWLPGSLYFLQPPVPSAPWCDLNLRRLPACAGRDCSTVGWAVGPGRDVLQEDFTPSAMGRWAKTQTPESQLGMVHIKLLGCRLNRHRLNCQKLGPSSLTKRTDKGRSISHRQLL